MYLKSNILNIVINSTKIIIEYKNYQTILKLKKNKKKPYKKQYTII